MSEGDGDRHLIGPTNGHAMGIAPAGLRRPTDDDAEALATLMLDAYRGTVDFDGTETIETARREVDGYFSGESGAAMLDVSRVVDDDDDERLVSAVLVSAYEDLPLIAYVMTAASHKRQGLATALLCESLTALADLGQHRAHLWVTAANAAVRIYTRLGFHDVPATIDADG